MPQTPQLVKAEIREIRYNDNQEAEEVNSDKTVKVQFNPESLKVNFANQKAGGDQRGGSAAQFVGAGTTKLSLDLWFDATRPLADGSTEESGDVRRLTQKVAYFITPVKAEGEDDKWIPPGVRFIWGTFKFDGYMDSLNESLDYFSSDGRPLRAKVSIGLSRQEIQFQFGQQQSPGLPSSATPSNRPQQQARQGDTLQGMAGRAGKADAWKAVAAANNIENPRRINAGTLIDVNLRGTR